MKNYQKTIHNALPIVAAAYGENFGVKVNVGGNVAYTNGKEINIPYVSDSFKNMDVIWGYLAHEAAHVRFTEFINRPDNLYGDLLNILEDTRIEREMCRVYPGTFSTLNAVAEYMAEQGHYAMLDKNSHTAQIIAGYCLYYLQYHYMDQAVLKPFLDAAKKAIGYVISLDVVDEITSILDNVKTTLSTAEVATLAKEIIALLKNESDSQDQSDSSDQVDSQGQSDSSDQGDSQGQGQNPIKAALNASKDELQGDVRDKLKETLQGFNEVLSSSSYMQITEAKSTYPNPKNTALLDHVASESTRIRQQLYGLVQAKNHTAKRTERRGKRIDSARISRVVSGNYRVFTTPSERVRPNTAVHILVDMSGSMGNPTDSSAEQKTCAEVAQESALALALALESINGLNVAVTYFNGGSHKVTSVVKHGEKVRQRASCFNYIPHSTTPLAEGIWYSAYQLTKVKQERKIILVITDGEPNSASEAKEAIALSENSGIDFIGIGISSPLVFNYFKNSINIDKVSELRSTLFSLMENMLVAA